MPNSNLPTLSDLRRLRTAILEASSRAGEGHIGSAFSILEILAIEYLVIRRHQKESGLPEDVVIVSKGHAAIGLYAVLAEADLIPLEWLDHFCGEDSPLGGHPDARKIPGVPFSTGSLGHGLALAVGLALGNRVLMVDESRPRIVVIVGDGELNEGSIWEALLLAAHHEIGEVTCVVDVNGSGDRALSVQPVSAKFEAFGWEIEEVDGHSLEDLQVALAPRRSTRPRAVIARTIKGFGIPEMENNPAWHHASPSREQLKDFIGDLR